MAAAVCLHIRLTRSRRFRYGWHEMRDEERSRGERGDGPGRASPARRTALFGLVLGLTVVGACAEEPQGPDLDTDTFIDVMVQLRRAQTWETTPAEFEQRRAEILREAGVTDSVLVQWARARGTDVTFMAEVWDSINARLVTAADSAAT